MKLIQKFFPRERSLPIITFLGRPTDSKKGLLLFLDALEMLTSITMIPNFIIWIIGGDDSEYEYVLNELISRTLLEHKYTEGAIMIWGRIENDALPELLSRSSILVMPSYREQFGMAAVEAMLCGCPVAGARVGGLNDLIIPQKTGFLFERGNSMALCAVLSGFLRNMPERKKIRLRARNWAKRFSQNETFLAITQIYDNSKEKNPNFWHEDDSENDNLSLLVEIVEKLINQKIEDIGIMHYHGKHLSIKITTEKGEFFVKKIAEQISSMNSVFLIDFNKYPDPKSTEEQFAREFNQYDNPYSPRIINYDNKNSILVTEYLETTEKNILHDFQTISNLIHNIRLYKPISESEAIMNKYYNALAKFRKKPSFEQIDKIDQIASVINERLTNGLPSFSRLHPQIELYRLKLMFEKNGWALPCSAKSIFLESINYLLKNVEFNKNLPTLAHGDLKEGHFLKSGHNILLCDWEHAKYCVGPLDEAKITFNIFHKDENAENALKYLSKLLPNDYFMLQQAIVWFVGQVISVSIYWYTQGDQHSVIKGSRYLENLILRLEILSENKSIIT